MDKLVSIIIPAYNVEDYIGETIESVTRQTYKSLEIIIIDDGSTDGTYNICCEYKKKDNRIKLIQKENAGVSSARNRGLSLAKGDFIAFVDGDDKTDPTMYETLLYVLEKENADIVSCSYYIDDGKQKRKGKGSDVSFIANRNEAIKKCVEMKDIFPSVWLAVYRKEILSGLSFREDLKISEDCLFNYQAITKCNKYVHIGDCLYFYRIRNTSAINSRKRGDDNALRAYDIITKDVKQNYPFCYDYAERLSIIYRLNLIRDYSIVNKEERGQIIDELSCFKKTYMHNKQLKLVFKILLWIAYKNRCVFVGALNSIYAISGK